MAGVKRLNFNLNTQVGHALRHVAQHPGGVGHDIIGLGKVHGAAVKRRNFRSTSFQMSHSLFTGHHVRSRSLQRERRIGRAEHQITTHSGGKIDHHVGVTGSNTFHDVTVKMNIAHRRTRLGVSHVTMNHCSPRLCRSNGVVGDLLRTARHLITAVLRTTRPCKSRGDEYFFAGG